MGNFFNRSFGHLNLMIAAQITYFFLQHYNYEYMDSTSDTYVIKTDF